MKTHIIYRSKTDDDSIERVGEFEKVGYLVYNLASRNKMSEEEMKQRLILASIEDPVQYNDEIYWTEIE